jgi:two-component system response regulator HydG
MSAILLAEDDGSVRAGIARALLSEGHQVEEAADGPSAIGRLATTTFDLVIADLHLPGADGLRVLAAARAQQHEIAGMVITGQATVASAVQAMQEGADDYIQKPFSFRELRLRVERVLHDRHLRQELAYLRHEQPHIYRFEGIVGWNRGLKEVFDIVRKVARTDTTLLIGGETGTGKEVVAGAIHRNSRRSGRAMVKVNCAALNGSLLESELFGHERGAFTGAEDQRIGRFEQADAGTLFLDEAGDLSPSTQAKLLRAVQEGEFERLGGVRTLRVDVRLVAATHRDLAAMVDAGLFRADLYYRLNVVPLTVPPLRERKEDIPELAEFFLKTACREMGRDVEGFEPQATKILQRHHWPGNIRELRNVVERAVLMCDARRIRANDLHLGAAFASIDAARAAQLVRLPPRGVPLADLERQTLLEALKMSDWVRRDAAQLLSITTRVFNYKMKALGIGQPRMRESPGPAGPSVDGSRGPR